jgi:hypothetical protein
MYYFRQGFWGAALLFALWVGTGCKTDHRADYNSFASIEITNHTVLEVARALSEVFEAAGFAAVPQPRSKDYKLQYEKRGSTGSDVLYSDWSGGVWYRVRLKIVPTLNQSYLVLCDAFRVLDRGKRLEEEHALSSWSRSTYQKMLEQAKEKLAVTPAQAH